MSRLVKVIAVDGPSGSGKSTIAKLVSEALGLVYLDTGAMFRGIGYILDKCNIGVDDNEKIQHQLNKLKFEYQASADSLIKIDGEDLTEKIREHKVSKLASTYSQNLVVRNYLKDLQREIAGSRASILDGRDIGTVIFPDAVLKIYLTADPNVRAKRRLKELQDKDPNLDYNLSDLLDDIIKRDNADKNRAVAPLKKSDDAIEIDSTNLSIEEIVNRIISEYRNRVD